MRITFSSCERPSVRAQKSGMGDQVPAFLLISGKTDLAWDRRGLEQCLMNSTEKVESCEPVVCTQKRSAKRAIPQMTFQY